eukprot:2423640-Pleurochrysis_carterae.AAC.1
MPPDPVVFRLTFRSPLIRPRLLNDRFLSLETAVFVGLASIAAIAAVEPDAKRFGDVLALPVAGDGLVLDF